MCQYCACIHIEIIAGTGDANIGIVKCAQVDSTIGR